MLTLLTKLVNNYSSTDLSLVSTIFGDVRPKNERFSGQADDTFDLPNPTLFLDNHWEHKTLNGLMV
jgi:hypothetical protein